MHLRQRLFLFFSLLCGGGFILLLVLEYQHAKTLFKTQQQMQATQFASFIAKGSVDNLLSRDYGELERWVTSAISDTYIYCYIQSPSRLILIHSDLSKAGQQGQAVDTLKDRQVLYRALKIMQREAEEVIQPILLENQLIGSVHLAYYVPTTDNPLFLQYLQKHLGWLAILLVVFMLSGWLIYRQIAPCDKSHSGPKYD